MPEVNYISISTQEVLDHLNDDIITSKKQCQIRKKVGVAFEQCRYGRDYL